MGDGAGDKQSERGGEVSSMDQLELEKELGWIKATGD